MQPYAPPARPPHRLLGLSCSRPAETDRPEDAQQLFCARLAEDKAIRSLLGPLAGGEAAAGETALVAAKEALLLEQLKHDRSLVKGEVILDLKRIHELALLQRGLDLLPAELQRGLVAVDGDGRVVVKDTAVLSADFAKFFQTLQARLADKALTLLYMLRLEARAQAFYFIDLALREGNYSLEDPAAEPDNYIYMLCASLLGLEAAEADWLPYPQYLFCTEGLAKTLEEILVSGFRYVKDINAHGYGKLQAAVKSLEQLLALVCRTSEPGLDRVRAYYELAQGGPHGLLESAKACPFQFTHRQYQAILDIHYKLDQLEDDTTEASVALRKEYHNQIVRLNYLNK